MARSWEWSKRKAAQAIVEERDVGYLDPGIASILEKLNSLPGLATTSSCIGRVALVEGTVHWGRDEDSRILYKTHGEITVEEIMRVVSRGTPDVWLKATGPIMHVRARSLDCAIHLLSLARESGFKHSGIIAHSRGGGSVIELLSAAQMAVPLVVGGSPIFSSTRQLALIVEKANMIVREGRVRLAKLVDQIAESPGSCG